MASNESRDIGGRQRRQLKGMPAKSLSKELMRETCVIALDRY
jgi:hypothetical protein